ncbi:MAG: aldehyde dehydrogenase family protein [Bdellovibrionales bacterium]|jgi:acyl-CoA reductase-like NAD-dependent aldehyde dehydrogenase|nr:aldehyde dehydrogenase family protein [Bdellovibrionales bacterium]MBT3525857.1 aldehyde dehydrogenase family protein [Bdellovibrionales bacterium]MBT7670106.1 aldehyde dehydrogenase family protein [Bdellovibrionales bacterium]MBT7766593.1 aldehyde dehydrogenase family protein [Bdellovibrionales bacterium]
MSERLMVTNPFSGELLGEFDYDSFEQQQDKVKRLRAAAATWRQVPLTERIKLVRQGMEYFEQHRSKIALDITNQMGRPLHQADGEINGFFERGNYLCSIAHETLAPDQLTDKPGLDRAIHHTPMGVIYVIAAWNYPLLIAVNSVVPALIAGNTILFKHSSITPKIGAHFQKAFSCLGENRDLLLNSITSHTTTLQVIEQLPVDHVVFTGSVSGGRKIATACASRFITPGLELGGKDGVYVHSDADLEAAVASVVDGAMFNSGQSCCGVERLYLHQDIYDQFIQQAQKLLTEYRLGDPCQSSSSVGPLAKGNSADYMLQQVQQAVSLGAKILTGGKIKKIAQGIFFEPTLMVGVDHQMEVMQEENFGPILPVMKVESLDQAIRLVNDSPYGLTSAIFTKNQMLAQEFADRVDAGTIFMNRCDYLDPALPWSGVKDSGAGSSLSKYGFYHLTQRKALHFKQG